MNRYAIGDIHGGIQTFRALIRKINPKHDDRVYLLGDYIDRGPDSKGVLDAIISMQESGCDIRPIRGNHDDMLYRAATEQHDDYSWYWMKGWGFHTLSSFAIDNPSDLPAKYVNFLASLPLLYTEQNFILAHAGLDMTKTDPITESAPADILWGDKSSPDLVSGSLHYRLITGHTVRKMTDIQDSLSTNWIFLDNGAFVDLPPQHGHLMALNLDTMQLTAQPWLDEEAIL